MVTDDDMIIQHFNDLSKGKATSAEDFTNVTLRSQEWIHMGDLPPGFSEAFSMRAATVTGDRRLLTINFWANNGSWVEKVGLRRVNGKWLTSIRVWRPRLDQKKRAVVNDLIFSRVDDGYPEDMNTKDPNGVSAYP
jgi:hypothetical protein